MFPGGVWRWCVCGCRGSAQKTGRLPSHCPGAAYSQTGTGPCQTALVQWHLSGYMKQRAMVNSFCTVASVWLYETKGRVKQLLYSGICLVIWNKGMCQTAFVQWHMSGYMKQRAMVNSSCTVTYVWLYETKGHGKQLLYSGICLVIWNKGPW